LAEVRLKVRWTPAAGLRPHDLIATVLRVGDGGRAAPIASLPIEAARAMSARTDLAAGAYMVQVGLPSGELLRDWFEVVEGAPAEVVLRARGRPRSYEPPIAESDGVSPASNARDDPGYGGDPESAGAGMPDEEIGRRIPIKVNFLRQPAVDQSETWVTLGCSVDGSDVVHAWSDLDHHPASRLRMKVSAQGDLRIYSRIELVDDGPERLWAVGVDARGSLLCSLPLPWPSRSDGHQAPIYLSTGRRIALPGGDFTVSVSDGALGGLVEYLGRGRLDGATPFLKEIDLYGLIGSDSALRNPLGACAAAYVGLATIDPRDTPAWLGLIPGLATDHPWLPDAAILNAICIHRLETLDLDELSAALHVAYGRGVPYLSTGLVQLREMLWICSTRDDALKAPLDAVTRVANRLDLGNAFTTLRYLYR